MIVDVYKAIGDIANHQLPMIDRIKAYIDLNICILCPDEVKLNSDRRIIIQSSNCLRSALHFYLSSAIVRSGKDTTLTSSEYFSTQDAERWLIETIKDLADKTSFMSREEIGPKLGSLSYERDDCAKLFNIALSPHILPNPNGKLRGISVINDIASEQNEALGISVKKRKLEELGSSYKHIAVFWHELRFELNQKLLGINGIKEKSIFDTIRYLVEVDELMTDISRISSKIELFNSRFLDPAPPLKIEGARQVAIAIAPLPAEVIDDLRTL